jgi:hypothetical protein
MPLNSLALMPAKTWRGEEIFEIKAGFAFNVAFSSIPLFACIASQNLHEQLCPFS